MAGSRVRAALTAGVLVSASACRDVTPITDPIVISGADAQLLYQEIQFSFLHAQINPRNGASAADGVGRPYLDCGQGGSVAFYGTDFSNAIQSRYVFDAVYVE